MEEDKDVEGDESITHEVVDSNKDRKVVLNRAYIQPQWVYDSVNEKLLLPINEYTVNATLPPHLSPFVDDKQVGYTPARRENIDKIKEAMEQGIPYINADEEDEEDDTPETAEDVIEEKVEEEVEEVQEDDEELEEEQFNQREMEAKYAAEMKAEQKGTEVANKSKGQKRKVNAVEEERKRAEIMITKKNRWRYKMLKQKEKTKNAEAEKLMEKRKQIENQERSKKKKKTTV